MRRILLLKNEYNWSAKSASEQAELRIVHLNITSSTLLSDLGWDSLERRRSKQLAIILYKILHNLSPTSSKQPFKNYIQCSLI